MGGYEDAEVLQQDRELCQEQYGPVDDFLPVYSLILSAFVCHFSIDAGLVDLPSRMG